MPARFFIIDGEIFDSLETTGIPLFLLNPSFRLEEKIWFCNGKIPLFDEHLSLLKRETDFLNLFFPESLKKTEEVQRLILRMINKNKAFHSGLIHLGLYFHEHQANLVISIQVNDSDFFELKKESVLATFSESIKYSGNELNFYRFYNQSFWDAAGFRTKKSRPVCLIILNEKDEIVECPETNIFFIKEITLYTPSPATGCYIDQIRGRILESAANIGLNVVETQKLDKQNILTMDEAFIGSESVGMQKITGVGIKRYTYLKTSRINEQLNRILLPG
jgi:branched-subunit amino acid aminotransferase/4-amino-4-deoxychorismate lyase